MTVRQQDILSLSFYSQNTTKGNAFSDADNLCIKHCSSLGHFLDICLGQIAGTVANGKALL